MSAALLFAAGCLSVVGAVLSLLCSKRERIAQLAGCLFGIAASAALFGSGTLALFGHASIVRFPTPIEFAVFSIRCDPLSGLFLAALSVLSLCAWIYGMSYFDEYAGKGVGRLGFFINLFVASMAFVVSLDNAFWFLVFFELMSLSSYFLVVFEQSPQSLRAGLLYFRLFVEGETILDADYRMFYVHRGMEKVAESRLTYDAVPFLADRICGICGCAHSVAYAESIESALGIFVPERARTIRSIMLEVERLHSHLLNLGLVCHFCGFDTGFQHFFRVREKSMNLAELLTGARKTYGLNLIGGVRRDILAEQKLGTLRLLEELRSSASNLIEELLSTSNFEGRTAGIGRLDPAVARDWSPVGPTVRGSGLARDVRFTHPYDGYRAVSARVRTHDGCDVKSRTLVRIEEFFDSIDMIEDWLENTPAGPILNESWSYEPHRFGVGFTEAPRGEDLHWAMTGDNQKCYRWRAKASTYSNWPVLRSMLRGNTISDAAMIVGSIDPCYSCTDRVTIIDTKKRRQKVVTRQQLENYCRNRTRSPLKDG